MECKIKVKSLTNSTVLSEKEFWVNKYIEMLPSDTILPSLHRVNFQDHCSHVNQMPSIKQILLLIHLKINFNLKVFPSGYHNI